MNKKLTATLLATFLCSSAASAHIDTKALFSGISSGIGYFPAETIANISATDKAGVFAGPAFALGVGALAKKSAAKYATQEAAKKAALEAAQSVAQQTVIQPTKAQKALEIAQKAGSYTKDRIFTGSKYIKNSKAGKVACEAGTKAKDGIVDASSYVKDRALSTGQYLKDSKAGKVACEAGIKAKNGVIVASSYAQDSASHIKNKALYLGSLVKDKTVSIGSYVGNAAEKAWKSTEGARTACTDFVEKAKDIASPYTTKKNALITAGALAATYVTYRICKWAFSTPAQTDAQTQKDTK